VFVYTNITHICRSHFVSTVEVTKGTSSQFRLIGGVPLVERVIIACPIILASLSFPEGFICSPCHVNLSLGDNNVQHLVDNKYKSSDIACIKCEE